MSRPFQIQAAGCGARVYVFLTQPGPNLETAVPCGSSYQTRDASGRAVCGTCVPQVNALNALLVNYTVVGLQHGTKKLLGQQPAHASAHACDEDCPAEDRIADFERDRDLKRDEALWVRGLLEDVVEKAPHTEDCKINLSAEVYHACTCWKAGLVGELQLTTPPPPESQVALFKQQRDLAHDRASYYLEMLRAVEEYAPHATQCATLLDDNPDTACSCWKAQVITELFG